MRINQVTFLVEGYKEATIEFNKSSNDPDAVNKIITAYKDLVTRNQLSGDQKNIDWWRKQGWEKFSSFVNAKAAIRSSSQIKRSRTPGNSVTIRDDDVWLIVVPLDKEASCFHGKNTDWCTTKQDEQYFEQYFYQDNVTLVYCIMKSTGWKWAMAIQEQTKIHKLTNSRPTIDFFDQQDDQIDERTFVSQTKLDVSAILNEVNKLDLTFHRGALSRNNQRIRELFKASETDPLVIVNSQHEIEKILIFLKNRSDVITYLYKVGEQDPNTFKLSRPVQAMLMDVMGKNPASQRVAPFITDNTIWGRGVLKNPSIIGLKTDPSIELQYAAVSENGAAIQYITDPSELIQMAAVGRQGYCIKYIKNPSERVQMAAVSSARDAIKFIENPSEKVQIVAVDRFPHAIQFINNPSPQVQMTAVRKNLAAYIMIDNPAPEVVKFAEHKGK